MASSPITLWQIDGQTVADIIFLGSRITAGGDYSHEIKRRLLLGRKPMTNLDSVLQSRDITLPHSQSYGFSSSHVRMSELDHGEELMLSNWCWRRLLRVRWTAPKNLVLILQGLAASHEEVLQG